MFSDLLVLGAGPAGIAISLLMARKGYSVEVFDPAFFPRKKICGEFLNPQAVAWLDDQQLLAPLLAHEPFEIFGMKVADRTGRSFTGRYSGRNGYAVQREQLDALLVQSAKQAGISIHEGNRVERLLLDQGRAAGVSGTAADGSRFEKRARLIVGADGRNNLIGRTFGWIRGIPGLRKYAFQTYFERIPELSHHGEVQVVQDGYIGKVTHCVLIQPGAYNQVMAPTEAPPADLDWDMFQGRAPRRPFSPSRLRWRSFYAYGGGLITDWGVHLTDIALLAMQADTKAPLHSSASAQYVAFPKDLEQVPDAFVCSWQYDNFVMSFTNAVPPSPDFGLQGNYFYGPKGVLHVNRSGYRVLPAPPRSGGRGAKESPPIEAKMVPFKEDYENDPHTIAHVRNFLDCIKSRKSPAADITTVGFHVTLPCLLGRLAVKEGKAYTWDGKKANPA